MSSDEQDEETKAISETKTEFVFFPPCVVLFLILWSVLKLKKWQISFPFLCTEEADCICL